MWARTTTVYATPDTVQAGIDYVHGEVWPAIRTMDGCLGMSMLVDREIGTAIVAASWADEASLDGSRPTVGPLREKAAGIMGLKTPPVVAEWEVASMHRDHHTSDGACVRVAWTHVPATAVDGAITWYRDTLLPLIEQLDGFVSANLMVNRAKGLGVTSVAFDSREAMVATRGMAEQLRTRSTQEMGIEFFDVAEFDLEMAHLHLPELV